MDIYEQKAVKEAKQWQKKMFRKPSVYDKLTKRLQTRVNRIIPERIHTALTTAIKQMVRAVLFGAQYTTSKPLQVGTLEERELKVRQRVKRYRRTAAAEGGITGAGGIISGIVDFPLLLGIKMKLLFQVASLYGFNVKDYKERLFMLHIFQLAFSSQQKRREVSVRIMDWQKYSAMMPANVEEFDWRSFQQEYRDYLDLAKLFQMIPGVGAVVGIVVNYRLINQLATTAMNAYRVRWMQQNLLLS